MELAAKAEASTSPEIVAVMASDQLGDGTMITTVGHVDLILSIPV